MFATGHRKADKFVKNFYPVVPILSAIFMAEFALMSLLDFMGISNPWVDSALLILFVSPFLYLYAQSNSRRLEEQKALLGGTRAVLRHKVFLESARIIFDECKRTTGATAGYVALLKENGAENEVLFLDSGGRPCSVDPTLPMPIRGLREIPYREGHAVYDNDFSGSPYRQLMPHGHVSLDNVLFAPLKIEGKVVGLLGLANKIGGFTEDDSRLAEMFGEMAAIALVNSHFLEEMADSESRFRSVVESSNDAIVSIDIMGNVVFWNRKAEELFGYSDKEMAGQPLTRIIPERFRVDHEEGAGQAYLKGGALSEGKTLEITGLRKNGEEFPLELSIYPWRTKKGPYYTGAMRDISVRKNAEAALRRSHDELERMVSERTAQLERTNRELSDEIAERRRMEMERMRLITAINQSAEMVVIARADGIVQYVNPAYERMTGYSRDEVVGRHYMLPEKMPSRAMRDDIWQAVKSGRVWKGNVLNWKKDGALYEEHAAYSPVFDDKGNIVNYVAIKRDTTGEGLLHKAREYFTAVTSHELRTPITKLQLVRTLLRDHGTPTAPDGLQPVLTVLDEAYGALNRIMVATTLFQELNRPEGEKTLAPDPLYLDLLLCLNNARLFIEHGKKKVRLSSDMERLPRDVETLGDHEMILSAIDNVLDNAIKFTPAGKNVTVSAWLEGTSAVIEVADEGAGIPKEQLGMVFEPYFSPENVLHHPAAIYSYAGGSIGLGLSITRMIMEYHKGSLSLDSQGEYLGTRVRLVFPLLERETPAMGAEMQKAAGL